MSLLWSVGKVTTIEAPGASGPMANVFESTTLPYFNQSTFSVLAAASPSPRLLTRAPRFLTVTAHRHLQVRAGSPLDRQIGVDGVEPVSRRGPDDAILSDLRRRDLAASLELAGVDVDRLERVEDVRVVAVQGDIHGRGGGSGQVDDGLDRLTSVHRVRLGDDSIEPERDQAELSRDGLSALRARIVTPSGAVTGNVVAVKSTSQRPVGIVTLLLTRACESSLLFRSTP